MESTKTGVVCKVCGMSRSEWQTKDGVIKSGTTYCCKGCAENTGCACPKDLKNSTPRHQTDSAMKGFDAYAGEDMHGAMENLQEDTRKGTGN